MRASSCASLLWDSRDCFRARRHAGYSGFRANVSLDMPFVVVDRLAEYRDCGADFSAAIFGFDRYPVSKPIAAALLFLGSSRVRFWYAAMVCYRTGLDRKSTRLNSSH